MIMLIPIVLFSLFTAACGQMDVPAQKPVIHCSRDWGKAVNSQVLTAPVCRL